MFEPIQMLGVDWYKHILNFHIFFVSKKNSLNPFKKVNRLTFTYQWRRLQAYFFTAWIWAVFVSALEACVSSILASKGFQSKWCGRCLSLEFRPRQSMCCLNKTEFDCVQGDRRKQKYKPNEMLTQVDRHECIRFRSSILLTI